MIPSQFYPTVNQINANTNIIDLTDNFQNIGNFTSNGLNVYYLGYLQKDNLPDMLCAYINDTDGDNIIISKVEPDTHPDFVYVTQAQNNVDSGSYLLSAYQSQNPFSDWYTYTAINAMSPLNTRFNNNQPIYIQYTYLIRKWTDPAEPSDIYYYTEYNYPSIQNMILFLGGMTSITFGMALGDGHYEYPNLFLSDFSYHNAYTHVYEYDGTSYDATLMINAVGVNNPMFCENNGYNTVGGRNGIHPTIHQKIDDVDYIVSAGVGRYRGIFDITNFDSQLAIDNIINYNDYVFFCTPLNFKLSETGTNFIRVAGDNAFVFSPSTNRYRVFIAQGWRDMSFMLALYPCLNSTDRNYCFFPEIVDNELTGNFYNYLQVEEKGTEWQKSGDIADDEYTEDDKPQPSPSDDGEDDTRKRNDITNLPEIGGIRLVSGTGFSNFYMLSAYHVAELGQLLSQMPSTFWEAIGTATDYKMSNILDYISALKWYPINITASAPALYPDTQISDIQFGFNGIARVTLTSGGISYRLGTVNRVFNMGSVDIPYRASRQTFLDLEPYTDVYANLPYIGKVQLQANQVLGYTITCYYIIDLITGIATCFMDNGYDTIYTGSGKIGVDISVAGNDIITQSERMATAYVGTVTHAVSNALSIGGNVAAANPAGAIVGTGDMISGLVADSIAAANSKRGVPQVVGGGSGFGSTYACQSPAIIVQRPAVKIPGGYGHSIGYIYNTRATIGSVSGFTVCDNPDLSGIPATSDELDMIRSILTSGFYA